MAKLQIKLYEQNVKALHIKNSLSETVYQWAERALRDSSSRLVPLSWRSALQWFCSVIRGNLKDKMFIQSQPTLNGAVSDVELCKSGCPRVSDVEGPPFPVVSPLWIFKTPLNIDHISSGCYTIEFNTFLLLTNLFSLHNWPHRECNFRNKTDKRKIYFHYVRFLEEHILFV